MEIHAFACKAVMGKAGADRVLEDSRSQNGWRHLPKTGVESMATAMTKGMKSYERVRISRPQAIIRSTFDSGVDKSIACRTGPAIQVSLTT